MINDLPATGRTPKDSPVTGPAIALDHVGLSFRSARLKSEIVALRDVHLEVPEGMFVALLGPSGCGKTTLLRLVDGLIEPDTGTVRVHGAPPKPGPDMGFVFQSFRLLPWATVEANVEFPLQGQGLGKAEITDRVRAQLNAVGLGKFRDAYPGELSGGMKQRVALARALVTKPRVLLMDEPFASIDAQTRELMQIELMKLWADTKATVLFVTHSVDEAIVLSDRVVLMGPRPGRIVDLIDVDLDRPRWAYDARADSRYIELRSALAGRLRDLVLADPLSDFYRP